MKRITLGKIRTSRTELVDISKAWLVLSLAFAFVYSGINLLRGNVFSLFSTQFVILFLVSAVTAGLGFLLHELAHKFVAQKYGCTAEFRAFDQMLYLALGLAVFVGFIFAAPGAVMIHGQITRKENGLISAAGPATNFVLGMLFLLLMNFYSSLNFIWQTGFFINMWLGLFNLIPFGNLDGYKVLMWNRYVWAGMGLFGIYFVFFF